MKGALEVAQSAQFDLEMLKQRPPFHGSSFLIKKSLKNRFIEGACTGYSLKIGSLSYRGVWVSTIENIILKVDGEIIPSRDIVFCVNNKKFLISQLPELFAEYWYALDPAELIIYKIGGLSKGEHEVEVTISRRNDFGYSHEFVAVDTTDTMKCFVEQGERQ
jgi:hypothetical protein